MGESVTPATAPWHALISAVAGEMVRITAVEEGGGKRGVALRNPALYLFLWAHIKKERRQITAWNIGKSPFVKLFYT